MVVSKSLILVKIIVVNEIKAITVAAATLQLVDYVGLYIFPLIVKRMPDNVTQLF